MQAGRTLLVVAHNQAGHRQAVRNLAFRRNGTVHKVVATHNRKEHNTFVVLSRLARHTLVAPLPATVAVGKVAPRLQLQPSRSATPRKYLPSGGGAGGRTSGRRFRLQERTLGTR